MIIKHKNHDEHKKVETYDGFYMVGSCDPNIESALNSPAYYKYSPVEFKTLTEDWKPLPLTWQTLTNGDQFKYRGELLTVVSASGLGGNRYYKVRLGGEDWAFGYFADELEQKENHTLIQPDFITPQEDTIEIEGKSYTVSEIKEALNK